VSRNRSIRHAVPYVFTARTGLLWQVHGPRRVYRRLAQMGISTLISKSGRERLVGTLAGSVYISHYSAKKGNHQVEFSLRNQEV
jgi:hypothetical protein